MKNHSLKFLSLTVLVFSIAAIQVGAQQYPTQKPGQTQQQPGQPPDQAGQPAPDTTAQTPVQIFTGTIAKANDKFVLQESSGGTIYNIDRQDVVKDLEGKKVRVHGTLDPDGKTIHVQ